MAAATASAAYDNALDDDELGLEDGLDMEIMAPNHPAMMRFQAALKRQLVAQKEEVEREAKAKRESLKSVKREREELGVQLYTAQQQLARLQAKLEERHDDHQMTATSRVEADDQLELLRKEQESAETQVAAARKEAAAFQAQYDKIARSALQAEKMAEEVQNEVAVSKRAAKKAARAEDEAETEKQQQDLYVDRLHERVKELNNERTITETQLQAQQEETMTARTALQEATMEVDAVRMEKKELQTQWTSSLNNLSKRNDALAAMEAALREAEQELFARQREVEGISKLLDKERQENEVNAASLARSEADLTHSRKTLESTEIKITQASRTHNMLTRSMLDAEEQLSRATTDYNIQVSNLNGARKTYERLALQIRENESKLMNKEYDHVTNSKAGKNLADSVTKIRKQRQEVDSEASIVENEIARLLVQYDEYEDRVEQSREQLEVAKAEVAERNALIAQYETQIRQNTTTIKRKQDQVDNLKRRIAKIVTQRAAEGEGNADIGPMEIEIKTLQRQIGEMGSENVTLQKQWLGKQSELVNLTKEMQQLEDNVDEASTRINVLGQRKFRLDKELVTTDNDQATLKRTYVSLQQDLVRLNVLITNKEGQQNSLEQDNVLMESDFLLQLKQDERESIQLQEQVQQAEEERSALLNAVVDAEQQILLWEKKIQLSKEMRDQLKPTDGAGAEVQAMTHEIHRMELRLEQLNRQKNVLIQQMEMSVMKRETITKKGKALAKKGGPNPSQGALKKEILELRKKIRQTLKDAARCQNDIAEAVQLRSQVEAEIESLNSALVQWEEAEADVQQQLQNKVAERVANLDEIVYFQRCAQHLRALSDGKAKMRHQSAEAYEADIEKLANVLQSINALTEYLQREHGELQEELGGVVTAVNAKLDQLSGLAQQAEQQDSTTNAASDA